MPASVLLPGVGDAAASTAGGFAAGVVTETGVELATLAGMFFRFLVKFFVVTYYKFQ